MKRSAVGCWSLAVLAFVLGVQAEPVSQLQASRAARTWAKAGRRFGVRIGNAVDTVSERQVTDNAKVYSVRMREGGTVLMSSDTDFEPEVRITATAVGDDWTAEARVFDGEVQVPAIKAIEDHVKVSTALGAEANWTKATCTAEIRNGVAVLTIQKPDADRGFMILQRVKSK